jgi:hypothetical protein
MLLSPQIPIRQESSISGGFALLLQCLGFRNQPRQTRAQSFGQRFGNIQGGISQTSLHQPNVRRMQVGFFGQCLLGQRLRFPVLFEHKSERIRHFQTPHLAILRGMGKG